MALKFCPNLSFMFQEASCLLERYELAKHAGFRGVECAYLYDYTPEEIADAKNRSGIQQVLINADPGDQDEGEKGFAAIPGKEDEFKSSIEKAIEYATKLDCKMIHIMAGNVDEETEENSEVYVNNLSIAADMLSENDIIGVIEPINKYSLPKYFLNSYEKAISVIDRVNKPNIKLQLDIFHMQQICGNLTRNIEHYLPDTAHIQIAQVPNRNGPFTPGEINYDYVFYHLRKLHYHGWIGLEYTPITKTKDALKWISEV